MDAWREFELLVSRIEGALAPKGAVVRSPDRIQDRVTGQLREVDASIRLHVGTTPVLITLECRDRSAVQDDTWIEQLAKKKEKIGASVTIAVSASGFTDPATRSAHHFGIELRTLTEISDSDAAKWAEGIHVSVEIREWRFIDVKLVLEGAPASVELAPTLVAALSSAFYETPVALRDHDRHPLTLQEMGGQFVQHGMFPPLPGVRPFGTVSPNDGRYLVPTEAGEFPLSRIELEVEVTNVSRAIPLRKVFEYANIEGPIVRVAEYEFHHSGGALKLGVIQPAGQRR